MILIGLICCENSNRFDFSLIPYEITKYQFIKNTCVCKFEVLFLIEPRDELKEYLQTNLSLISVKLHFGLESNDYDIANIDCIVGWRPKIELLQKATKLKLFINPGAGVQHYIGDLSNYFKENNIILSNGHGNAYFTAQHAVALLLSLANKVVIHHNWMEDGLWRRGDSFAKSVGLRNTNIGLLGFGNINKYVHTFLSGFESKFHVLKRTINDELIRKYERIEFYTQNQLTTFLEQINIMIIAIPSTSESVGMIGKDELSLLGESALIVNVGRGDLINQTAFFEALRDNKIGGAAIDVWYNYQPEKREGKKFPFDEKLHPFHELDNVVLSPHRAASPFDNLERWGEVIQNLTELANGGSDFINQVDLELGY